MQTGFGLLTIHLNGPFQVLGPDGRNMAPKSAKAQGVLALLATSPNGARGRRWLQDRLWSDRGPEQGAQSLRQALSEIRRAFGWSRDRLEGRTVIALDPALVRVATDDAANGEFLEGIDVRDAGFEAWLAAERLVRAGPAPEGLAAAGLRRQRADPWRLHLEAQAAAGTAERLFEDLFVDAIARTLNEAFSIDVVVGRRGALQPDAFRVSVQAFAAGPRQQGLRATFLSAKGNRQLWSGHRIVLVNGAPPIGDPEVQNLGNQLVEAIGDCLMLERRGDPLRLDANIIGRMAVRMMFSMRPAELEKADRLLAQAFEIDPRGIFPAWRAQLRTIQLIERHGRARADLIAEGEALVAEALLLEPCNSMVLATLANTRLYLLDDIASGIDLAERSVRLNGANPLGWWALSAAQMYAGKYDAADRTADAAVRLAVLSPHRFWWDNQKAAAAMMCGKTAESMVHFQRASAAAPDFRPPMRYLAAYHATKGQEDRAMSVAGRLAEREPDFTIDRLVRDDSYPASLVRRSGLFDADRIAALA
jgi:tetratricopeptide (TPR) repeat protein